MILHIHILVRDAMIARYMLYDTVCLYVRPSVSLSQVAVSKRLNTPSSKQRRTIVLSLLTLKILFKLQWRHPFRRAIGAYTRGVYTNYRMWANAQRDGCPAEYTWRRLFNAAKFG